MFKGSITALITPFQNGKVDYDTFGRFIEWQIAEGIHGFVPCGTTGESPTLNHHDHNEVIKFCIQQTKGRIPIIAGTGSNSTEEAIDMSRIAEKNGADALLIVVPYYNKPTQEGMYQHFKAVAEAVGLPVIIYNVPGRSVANISNDTIKRLLDIKNIAGIKDATGDLNRLIDFKPYIKNDFSYLSGEDALALESNRLGGCGTISVTSNIAPKLCAEVQNLFFAGKLDEAKAIQDKLMVLHDAMFCETSPGPVKYAAKLIGFGNAEMRLPMVEIADSSKQQVEAALKALKLI
jgi:4-hydroxy-tetrahydrodipicolinate synthase